MDLMGHIPDIVFLILGIAGLLILLSIRSGLRKLTRQNKHEQRHLDTWSFEDQLKHRIKYLRHCRHLEEYLKNYKTKAPQYLN
jgi:hypothetical protein